MNKKSLLILLLTWVLASCEATGPIATVVCEDYSGPDTPCSGDPKAPEVNLNTNSMLVNPRCVKAEKGKVVIFKITPTDQNEEGTVEIFAKDSADDWWLAGTNSPNQTRILILTPEEIDAGENDYVDFNYGFRTSTKCVDPRIRVEN